MPGSLARPRIPRDLLLLLIALSVALFCFQYITLEKLSVLPPSKSYNTLHLFAEQVRQNVTFDGVDGLLLGLIAVLLLAILFLEVRRSRFSLFLGYAFASERRTLALLGLSSLVLVRFYFARGELSWAGDAAQHIMYSHLTAETLARGEFPIWTNYFGTGSPYLQFYGFLFFYVVALVDLLCRDLFISLKLVLAGTHVASGIAMYLLVRLVCRSRRAGFLAGLGYVLSFWHTQQVLGMGRLPLSLFYALLPLPFYCFERLSSSPRQASLVTGGGLSLGLLIFTHPGYAFWAIVLLAVYMGLRLGSAKGREDLLNWAGYSAAMTIGGLVFGAYLILPMWVERAHTGLYAGFTIAGLPTPSWQHLLVWSDFRFWLLPLPKSETHWYGGYLGLSLVGLALAGLSNLFGRHYRRGISPSLSSGICLAIVLVLAFGYNWPLVRGLPMLHIMSPERYLLFAVFFLSLAAGTGANYLLRRRWGRRLPVPLFTLLLSAVLMDLGPTTFQHLYLPVDMTVDPSGYPLSMFAPFREEADPYRQRGELPDYRIFWAGGPTHGYLAMNRLQFLTKTASPHAPHPGELRAVFLLVKPLEKYLNEILSGEPEAVGRLASRNSTQLILEGLGLLNVKYLLYTQADRKTGTINLPAHTPILVSPRVSGPLFPHAAELDPGIPVAKIRTQENLSPAEEVLLALWIIRQTQVDLSTRTCQRLLLLDYEGEEDLGTTPSVEVLEHRVWNQKAEMRVRIDSACFARLAYAYFPYLRVTVDGRQVSPWQTADRFIALRLEPGEHQIVLEPHLSPLRRWLLALDSALLLAAIWIWGRERRRRSVSYPSRPSR